MWRPKEGWSNPYSKDKVEGFDYANRRCQMKDGTCMDELIRGAREKTFEDGADAMGLQSACLVLNILFYKVPSVAGDESGEWWVAELRDKNIPIKWDTELGEFIPEEE